MCTTPLLTLRLTLRRGLAVDLALRDICYLLSPYFPTASSDGLTSATAGSSIGPGSLATYGQTTTVTHASESADFNQAFDVQLNFTAKIAFNFMFVNFFAQTGHFVIR